MVNDKELAAIIARKIFEAGNKAYPLLPVERIQFMHGKFNEHGGGGFGEGSLADLIEGVLREHRSY